MTTNDAPRSPTKDIHGKIAPPRERLTRDRIDAEGRLRIAAFVHAALGWAGQNSSKKFIGTGRVSRATIDRVKRGEEVSDNLLRALGDVLDLPRDFLLYIGYADIHRIERLADEADDDLRDLIRWTLDDLLVTHAIRYPQVDPTACLA